MKCKVTKVLNTGIVKTAALTGTLNGKTIELGATNTNTSWTTVFGKTLPKVGDEIEVDDSLVQVANDPATGRPTGRHFIARVSADKALQAVKLMQAENMAKSFSI